MKTIKGVDVINKYGKEVLFRKGESNEEFFKRLSRYYEQIFSSKILLDEAELKQKCKDCIKEYQGEKWTPCVVKDYCDQISIKEILKTYKIVDQDELQLKNEHNTSWVKKWKQTVFGKKRR